MPLLSCSPLSINHQEMLPPIKSTLPYSLFYFIRYLWTQVFGQINRQIKKTHSNYQGNSTSFILFHIISSALVQTWARTTCAVFRDSAAERGAGEEWDWIPVFLQWSLIELMRCDRQTWGRRGTEAQKALIHAYFHASVFPPTCSATVQFGLVSWWQA